MSETAPNRRTAAADVVGALEAVLFVATAPLSVRRLAEVLELEVPLVEAALAQLQVRLDETRGLELRRVAGGYQLVTRAAHAAAVARLGPVRRVSLSSAALEVLAVIAYRQPVTRAEIEAVRGVNSESTIRTLLDYGLIEEAGRKDAPGRPILYATTQRFLETFGLNDVSELPPLEAIGGDGDGRGDGDGEHGRGHGDEDGRGKEDGCDDEGEDDGEHGLAAPAG